MTAAHRRNSPKKEKQAFIGLLRDGGEIGGNELPRNISCAKALAFYYNGNLKGVAALKHPYLAYRRGIADKTGTDLNASLYPYELRYVFVVEDARGTGICGKLVHATIKNGGNCGIFQRPVLIIPACKKY